MINPVPEPPYQCGTLRQHFNHLRNNSSTMRNLLSWGQDQPLVQSQYIPAQSHTQVVQPNLQNKSLLQTDDPNNKQKRNVSFDATQNTKNTVNLNKSQANANSQSVAKRQQPPKNNSFNSQNRPRSANPPVQRTKGDQQDIAIRERIRQKELEEEAERKEERREKVKQFIQELKPYTRSLTNTKYQDYFDKAALESYGRANTKNAIGGIIYGNHQKTFNMNPHIRGNEPKNYQTHQTAINYGKRTKLNENDKWNRLEKELSKKLGLKDKNESLKEGKEVVYVDVDDDNMHSVMKENLEFKKQHEEQIRALQKDYKAQIEKEKKDAIEEFYAQKRERILSNNTIDAQQSTYTCPRDQKGRLQEQVVYRHTDKNGVVRIGADRHALTCFVDMQFPQNDAAYTQELINRMPIYPIEVADKDKFIDDQRRANYQKSLTNVYPSHYLLPNCDQPEIIKMIHQKHGEPLAQTQGKNLASTVGSNGLANSSSHHH